MKDQKTKERFLELRASGMSYSSIAAELGCSKQTLIDWSKEFWIELHNLRQANLESLVTEFQLSQECRLRLFGERLKTIMEELDRRDLSDVSTERLLDLALKYLTTLGHEPSVPKFMREVGYMRNEWEAPETVTWEG